VRPGVAEALAIFVSLKALIKLDFPTLERPQKTSSLPSCFSQLFWSAADFKYFHIAVEIITKICENFNMKQHSFKRIFMLKLF
jgi:hypothetical protein